MSDGVPQTLDPEEIAKTLGVGAFPGVPSPSKGSLRRKLILAGLFAGIGFGASIMSCVGQSFSYRQARAMEGIEEQLKEIRAGLVAPPTSCPVPP